MEIQYKQNVLDIKKQKSGAWLVKVKDLETNETTTYESDFAFIGAGGASLPLLQRLELKQSKHIGGFPVSGLFLRCTNQEVIDRHHAKVYGIETQGCATNVSATLRYTFCRRQAFIVIWSICRFLTQIFENRFAYGFN